MADERQIHKPWDTNDGVVKVAGKRRPVTIIRSPMSEIDGYRNHDQEEVIYNDLPNTKSQR